MTAVAPARPRRARVARRRAPALAAWVGYLLLLAASRPACRGQPAPPPPAAGAADTGNGGSGEGVGGGGGASGVPDGLPPITPLRLLLGTAKYKSTQLSPDGRHLAYARPSGDANVYSVFVKRLPPPGQAPGQTPGQTVGQTSGQSAGQSLFDREGVEGDLQVTADSGAGVRYTWAADSGAIFYLQDVDGDENDHLWMVDLRDALAAPAPAGPADTATPGPAPCLSKPRRAPPAVDLTPFAGVKATNPLVGRADPNSVYFSMNRRDPKVFDLYRFDRSTGRLALEVVNPGDITDWLADCEFRIRGAVAYNNTDGSTRILIRDDLPPPQPQLRAPAARPPPPPAAAAPRPAAAAAPGAAKAPAAAAAGSAARPPGDAAALFKSAAAKPMPLGDWIKRSASGSDARLWRALVSWPFGEKVSPVMFAKGGSALYVTSSLGRDTTELQLVSTAPGAKVLRRVASSPVADVGDAAFDDETCLPLMVSFDYLRASSAPLDPRVAAEWGRLAGLRPGEVASIQDISRDWKTWTVKYAADNTTSRLYLHRPGSWPPTLLLETQPELSGHRLANMHPLVIPARDSLRLPAYLTLPLASGVPAALPRGVSAPPPPGALADGTVDAAAAVLPGARPPGSPAVAAAAAGAAKRAAQGAGGGGGVHFMTKAELARWRPPAPALSKEQASPGGAALSQSQAAAAAAAAAATAGAPRPLNLSLPMVLLVHGGPWLRDGWGADGVGQWLANRGYAVLQVNFRGSEGFGKAFLNLGNREWGPGAIQRDLSDAVAWAVSKGIADPKRVCVFGSSFGGYSALAGLAFHPGLYTCGASLSGISDVGEWMRAIPAYWAPVRFELTARIGNADTNQTLNAAISPAMHTDSMRPRARLLLAAGANDPRVPKASSDKMYSLAKSRGLDVTYVTYSDEGHGLSRPPNRVDFYMRAERFLAAAIGGRVEPLLPISAEIDGTSARVVGAD